MPHYTVDPQHSTVTVVARPRLADTDGPRPASATGEIEVTDGGAVSGTLTVTLEGTAGRAGVGAAIDLDGTTVELRPDADGRLVLHGRTVRSAGTFGLAGSPLLNPSLELRWRLALVESA